MKKWLAFLLVLALPVCALAQSADLVGVWTMTGVDLGGIVVPADEMAGSIVFDLKADGSAVVEADGLIADATWKVEGEQLIIEMDGEQMVMPLREEGFGMDLGNDVMAVFGTEAVVMDDATMEALRKRFEAAANDAPLEGSFWRLDTLEAQGYRLSAQELGMSLTFSLNEDGQLDMEMNGQSYAGEWSVENGQLIISYYDSVDEQDYVIMLSPQIDGSYGGTLLDVHMNFVR